MFYVQIRIIHNYNRSNDFMYHFTAFIAVSNEPFFQKSVISSLKKMNKTE